MVKKNQNVHLPGQGMYRANEEYVLGVFRVEVAPWALGIIIRKVELVFVSLKGWALSRSA